MSESINQIDSLLGADSYYRLQQQKAAQAPDRVEKDTDQKASKYIIEGNSIIYESYDRDGKLISRVPWTAQPIDERA